MNARSVITLDHIRRRCPVCHWLVEQDHEEALRIVEEASRDIYLSELFATFGDLREPVGLVLVDEPTERVAEVKA